MRRLVASDDFWCVLLVVTMLAGIGYIILDTFVGPPAVAMAVEMEEPRPKTHQVMPGDTLWGIASPSIILASTRGRWCSGSVS